MATPVPSTKGPNVVLPIRQELAGKSPLVSIPPSVMALITAHLRPSEMARLAVTNRTMLAMIGYEAFQRLSPLVAPAYTRIPLAVARPGYRRSFPRFPPRVVARPADEKCYFLLLDLMDRHVYPLGSVSSLCFYCGKAHPLIVANDTENTDGRIRDETGHRKGGFACLLQQGEALLPQRVQFNIIRAFVRFSRLGDRAATRALASYMETRTATVEPARRLGLGGNLDVVTTTNVAFKKDTFLVKTERRVLVPAVTKSSLLALSHAFFTSPDPKRGGICQHLSWRLAYCDPLSALTKEIRKSKDFDMFGQDRPNDEAIPDKLLAQHLSKGLYCLLRHQQPCSEPGCSYADLNLIRGCRMCDTDFTLSAVTLSPAPPNDGEQAASSSSSGQCLIFTTWKNVGACDMRTIGLWRDHAHPSRNGNDWASVSRGVYGLYEDRPNHLDIRNHRSWYHGANRHVYLPQADPACFDPSLWA